MPVSRRRLMGTADAEPQTAACRRFKQLLEEEENPHAKAQVDQRLEFEAAFQRSHRGNLWRNWSGMTLTVFRRADGGYAWCISDHNGPRYSDRYDAEGEALAALWWELEEQWDRPKPPC